MQVVDHMSVHVITGSVDMPLPKVWDLIQKRHLHSLPIVDKNNKIVGLITKQEILEHLYPEMESLSEPPQDTDQDIIEKLDKLKKMTAEKVMNKRVVYTRPDTNIMRVLSRMIVNKVRQLPVVDDEDKMVGIISKADVFSALLRLGGKKG